jgi:hypothetical protein
MAFQSFSAPLQYQCCTKTELETNHTLLLSSKMALKVDIVHGVEQVEHEQKFRVITNPKNAADFYSQLHASKYNY